MTLAKIRYRELVLEHLYERKDFVLYTKVLKKLEREK